MSFIANLYAIFATFPIIPFVVVFLIFKYFVMNNSKDATGWAINITTIFLISANVTLINQFGNPSKGGGIWWIVFIFILLSGGISYLQFNKRREILWPRLLRAVWRLGFLSLSIMYVVLFVAHLSVTIFS